MSTKAGLKAAKAALDAGDYNAAIKESQSVLSSDKNNYFAQLFLGRAYEKQGDLEDAANAYQSATKIKPGDTQGWQGLCSLYEAQGSKQVDAYRQAAIKLAELFARADDQHRCQTTVDNLVAFSKKCGTKTQYIRALETELPSSSVYDFLEGRIPHPSHTYTRIAEIIENEEAQTIRVEIGSRRTRVGARLGEVTSDVKREVYAKSNLKNIYRQIINWSADDEIRRQYEEKLLERGYEILMYLPAEQKATKLNDVLNLAEGMVIIHHPFQLAWDLVLESRDLDDLQDLDVNVLREYIQFFENSGLGKILRSWLSSELSPFATSKVDPEDAESSNEKTLDPEDRLLLMTDGLALCERSSLGHRLVADYYLHLEEHESAIDIARAGLKVLVAESHNIGLSMQNTKDALSNALATSLVHHQIPRNHPEARQIFEDILQRKPSLSPALVGLGLIFEENEEFDKAIEFFKRALNEDQSNITVGIELAWCEALNGDYALAKNELESYLPQMKADDPRARDLRAKTLYRVGICTWELDSSRSARKDRNGAYSSFLAAIKSNANFAPAYTSLGNYYADYAKDKKRARQCFQKAFELSASETTAAERLARSFADQSDWHIVEVIAQRVIDSGRARPPPGSKKKGLSWPFSALGVVQMNRQEYQQAIVSFLAALRISPHDYQSYVGLGESYHNSGRYNSALRTFTHALNPQGGESMDVNSEVWFARYMLANVHRELGDYEEAINGLRSVLESRPSEFGVLMSLLQTFVERSWRSIDTGLYGQAISSACNAIDVAITISKDSPDAFNMWKAIGDSCFAFSWVQSGVEDFPQEKVKQLLETDIESDMYQYLREVDRVDLEALKITEYNAGSPNSIVPAPLLAGILAYKRAIHSCSHDIYAQAVAWYNLGWAENRTYIFSSSKSDRKTTRKFLQASVSCFKRAIELEAGNAEFWNALGVATTTLNPKVAQHAFVRSLHLNELNAKVWTNLGVLYLLQDDLELSHQAFGRAQSTDPDYAHAWVGEGTIALITGDHKEALNHFTHAFEISDSSSMITKRQYGLSTFDHLLATPSASSDLTSLIQPIFALEQLQRQSAQDLPYQHLAALFLERVGNHVAAIDTLSSLCEVAEVEYESSESLSALARYAHAKGDLARNQLAAEQFEKAAENAEIALDLSSDAENSGLTHDSRIRLRLSAHLTAGLAFHYSGRSADSISMFRLALQESDSQPDVVATLVRVLWAHGQADEKSVAREQLFECVEKHSDHVPSVTLLGAIAALSDDTDTLAAVTDDLHSLRTTKKNLTSAEEVEIQNLLATVAGLELLPEEKEKDSVSDQSLTEAKTAIMLSPENAQAWSALSELGGSEYAARMALGNAQKAAPPFGTMDVDSLAMAFAGVGTVASAQRAVVHAPWKLAGWEALAASLSNND